jgi:hypothetical protein
MTPQTGMPPCEGRYVVFCRCESRQASAWVEPVIATYTPGKWHVPGGRPVYGWLGPIPPMKAESFFEMPALSQEYDL